MSITINISFPDDLLAEIDQLAKKDKRSRSELIRAAARQYIERRGCWDEIFAMGRALARSRNLTEQDIATEIEAYRKSKAARRRRMDGEQL